MSKKPTKTVPGITFFTKAANLLILNFLCLICCIPVLTIADSLASLYSVMLKIVRGDEDEVVKPFFRFFGKNFVKSIPYTIVMVVSFVLILSGYIAFAYDDNMVAIGLLSSAVIIVITWFGWAIPLFAQFDNGFFAMMTNAMKLMVMNLRESLIVLIMNSYMIVLFLVVPAVFVYVLYIWGFLGLAVTARVVCDQLVPVFDELMNKSPEGEEDGE